MDLLRKGYSMRRLIVILFLGLLYTNTYAEEPNEPQDANDVCDCNCICQPDPNMCDCNNICEPLPTAYLFEDFNEAFDLKWTILNEDILHWSWSKYPGSLTVTSQNGSFESSNNNYKNVFLTKFPLPQALDFQVTTCISNFRPKEIGNQAGFLLWYDKDNYFKFVYEFGAGPDNTIQLLLVAGSEIAGIPGYGWFQAEQAPQTMWLRMIKHGDLYELYNSTDGTNFNPLNVLPPDGITENNTIPCPNFPVNYIGIYSNNGNSSNGREVDASFDFFEFKTLQNETDYADEPNEPNEPQDVNVCDCNCICESDPNISDCNCVCEPWPITYLLDDFNEAFDLNWAILKEDVTHWSWTKNPGTLTITTQSGSFESYYTNYHNVFLIDFPISQALDFQITTCITNFYPKEVWNQAGLLLWYDEDNYLKFVYEYGHDTPQGDGLLFTVGRQIKGSSYYSWFLTDQTPQTMWMRIIKRGAVYEMYNSTDGITFLPLIIYRGSGDNTFPCLTVPIKNIGIFGSNYITSTAPEVDASFEFFEFKILPKDK
jgi:regulation of enolase protein 1 (concanavalin A-like superfamily)